MNLPIDTSQLTDLLGDAKNQAGGLTAKLPGMAAEAKAYASPALLNIANNAKSSITSAAASIPAPAASSAASIASVPGKPLRDASGPTMPKAPVEDLMLQPKEGVLDGFRLDMETIEDTFEKAIAQYDYPYADGADLEDMGQKAHKLRIKCYFFDNAEQQTYNYHIDLLNSLALKDLIDLVHPKYGLMKVKIESIAVQHDDRERCAVLDISFIEQMRGYIEPTRNTSVLSEAEEAYINGQDQQQEKLAADIKDKLPAADSGMVSKILDSGQGLLTQVQEYSNKARSFVGGVEGYISIAESVVNQVMSPVNSLQATILYAETLPGRILGDITRSVEKVSLLYISLRSFPSIFMSRLNDAYTDLQDSFSDFGDDDVINKHLLIAIAQRIALEAASIYADDEQAFIDGDTDIQIMNIRELEETLAIVRARLEAAVELARDMDSLKITAQNLLNHVNTVRLEREKMIKVTLDNPMPLHLVCLKYGLPYTDAERLLRINRIPQPNFTDGEVLVYAA
jgi:prophage DNA circulation protein